VQGEAKLTTPLEGSGERIFLDIPTNEISSVQVFVVDKTRQGTQHASV
jgi:hypothetical protein